MTVYPISTIPALSVFSTADTIFEIHVAIDLQDATITMGHNTVLRFVEGSFSNGIIRGNDSYIEASGHGAVFFGVNLVGQWRGAAHDRLFSYEINEDPSIILSTQPSFTPILASLLCFEKIDLYRKKYYLDWARIGVDTNQDIELDGHGAIWYISSNKGAVVPWNGTQNPWGPKYEEREFISFEDYVRNVFRIRNLVIEDNSETIPDVTGYGESIDYSDTEKQIDYHGVSVDLGHYGAGVRFPNHIVYSLFNGLASRLTEFDNVRYDGGGEFFKSYNARVDADRLVFRNCDLYTGAFAIEVQNLGTTASPGNLREAIIDNCIIHNHLSRFVGVLSFADIGCTRRLKIINSKICGCPGNLEVWGVEQVLIDNTMFANHGLCSEYRSDLQKPRYYQCTNSHFYLTTPTPPPSELAFCAMGNNVLLDNNHFYLTRNLTFCNIKRLYFYNNTIVVPKPEAEYILVAPASAEIGYYANNQVSSPRVDGNHVYCRLDTTYVMAQYEPFKVAFNKNIEETTYCYTFNWSNELMTMGQFNEKLTELQQSEVTLNNEDYAVGYSSPAVLPTSVVNNTVSITLIGKSCSEQSGEYILVSSLEYTTPFSIRVSQQSVFRVYLGSQLIADIPRHTEDVRIDVTITRIHNCFEIFVFLDKELFAKYSCPEDGQAVPSSLSFSPNYVTAIKAIRFVSGGFILDELDPVMSVPPQPLLTELLDE